MRFLISEKLGPHKYKTPEGYLVCVDAILSRTGTQEYRRCELFGDACDDPDRTMTVDRKADEVFSDKAMASFENKAICIEHPNANVDVKNHNDLSVGFVRDIRRGEDNGTPVMMGTLVITDKEAVEAVESGEYKELSCGYDCDIEDERSPQQRNIRGNHVALCKQGRAGIARIVDSKTTDTLDKNVRFQARNIAEWIADGNGSNASDNEINEYFKDCRITLSETQLHEAIAYIRQMVRAYNNEHKMSEDFWDWMDTKGKRFKDVKVNDGVTITGERSAKFDLPGYHKGDIGKCSVWYGDLKHVKLQLDGTYKESEKSHLIWIAGKTEYAGKEGRNTGKFKVKYDIWSTFAGVKPYLTSNTISGVVVTDDINILKDVSEAFMNDAMKTVNDLISKMRSKGINDDVTVDDAYTDFEYGYRDGKAGTYDKWYRYNRKDEGKEYDMGIQKAKGEGYEIKKFIKGTGDSMKDELLTDMDLDELMKYYTGKNTKSGSNIFMINGKYALNPIVHSERYNTIAELEAAEAKQHAEMRKGYASNDPNQFGDSTDDAFGDKYSMAFSNRDLANAEAQKLKSKGKTKVRVILGKRGTPYGDETTYIVAYQDSMTNSTQDASRNYTFKLAKRKNDYDEFVIKAYLDGKYNEGATYYTDDWEDAVGTLKAMAKQYNLNVATSGTNYTADALTSEPVQVGDYVNPYSVGAKYKFDNVSQYKGELLTYRGILSATSGNEFHTWIRPNGQVVHSGLVGAEKEENEKRGITKVKDTALTNDTFTDASTISAFALEKGWYIANDVRAPDKLNAKILTKRTYQSKGKKRITGTTVLPDGSTGYYDYGYTEQVKFSSNLQDSAQTQDSVYTIEYVKDKTTYIRKIKATSLKDAILKAKDELKDTTF